MSITRKREKPSSNAKSVNTQAAPSATVAPTVWPVALSWAITLSGLISATWRSSTWVAAISLPGSLASQSAGTTARAVVGSAMPSPGATGRKKV